MAKTRPWIKQEEAYILGLLHDLGWMVMAIYFNDYYKSIQDIALQRSVPAWYIESEYGLTHARVGKWLAIKWALPEMFTRVMEFHHTPGDSPSFKSEVKIITLADMLANSREHLGYLTSSQAISYCKDLFITEDEWDDYQGRLGNIWPKVDELWGFLR